MQSGSLVRWKAPLAGDEMVIAPAYIVTGPGGDWELSATGPAEAYWVEDVGGDFVIDASATAHDPGVFFKFYNSEFEVR